MKSEFSTTLTSAVNQWLSRSGYTFLKAGLEQEFDSGEYDQSADSQHAVINGLNLPEEFFVNLLREYNGDIDLIGDVVAEILEESLDLQPPNNYAVSRLIGTFLCEHLEIFAGRG